MTNERFKKYCQQLNEKSQNFQLKALFRRLEQDCDAKGIAISDELAYALVRAYNGSVQDKIDEYQARQDILR